MEWYKFSTGDIFNKLSVNESGLTSEIAKKRFSEFGPNKLPEAHRITSAELFFRQFKSPLIYILLISAGVVFLLGETIDSIVIAAVLLINAIVGSIQEGKAQDSLKALQNFVKTEAMVVRDGAEMIVSDEEVVPGDIIVLREGDKVPADARVIFSESLAMDEAALTGESGSVRKSSEVIEKDNLSPADQKNMVFKGTYVVGGLARVLVVGTGVKTVIGGISMKLVSIDSDMPLKADIKSLSRLIIFVVGLATLTIFALGLSQGVDIKEMFIVSIAVAVSAIPEGLPVVVTLVLATGVYRMGKKNALVKKLQAVEALGQADVVAVDKTGTITLNQMTVSEVYTGGNLYKVSGFGYEPKGFVMKGDEVIGHLEHPDILMMGRAASLTASARFGYSEKNKGWQRISGDPTEVAMAVFSEKVGFKREVLVREYPRTLEMPFDSRTKHHSTVHIINNVPTLFVAGAPEVVLSDIDHVFDHNGKRVLTKNDRDEIHRMVTEISSRGLRVIALAMKENPHKDIDPFKLPALEFVGLFGIADTLREEAFASITTAQNAGIKVVMITGDHVETAKAVAAKAGIYKAGDYVLTGKELETLNADELKEKIKWTTVFARVTPEHKLIIIQAYKNAGMVIAMTGDGVNDALSLSAADLGISMGKIGTEVAKEASDIVLLDDNFGSIVAAIEEGRNIYKTIKKVVLYLFSTSLGGVLTIGGAILLGFEVPLSASQIIWLNFITGGFLVVALAMEPKEGNLLSNDGKNKGRHILDMQMYIRMFLMGSVMMLGTMLVFSYYESVYGYVYASTIALTTLAVFQWLNALNVRSSKTSIFKISFFSNKYLVWAFITVITLQIFAVYLTPFQAFLGTTSIKPMDWLLILLVAIPIIIVDEIYKVFIRLMNKNLLGNKGGLTLGIDV